jgi:hypothetical protein
VAEIPFCCRTGHIPLSRRPPCPGGAGWRGRQPYLLMYGVFYKQNFFVRQIGNQHSLGTWMGARHRLLETNLGSLTDFIST